MARRDLAGLAALGALGMMMAKRKGKADMEIDPESADRANAISRGRTGEALKEVPFRGMSVKDSDALPAYLAKQDIAAKDDRKPTISDVYVEDESPVYKKNEFGEVYRAVPERRLKAYQDRQNLINANVNNPGYSAGMKKGGKVKKMASGGVTRSSASKRADGIATKGKTRGRYL